MPTPVFSIDRNLFMTRGLFAEMMAFHLREGSIVQVVQGRRFVYEVRPVNGAMALFDAAGRQVGLFADAEALVAHAEASTA